MYAVSEIQDEVKFNKDYYPLIRDGVKTQTLRLARKRLDVREGTFVKAVFPGIDEVLLIRINKIGYKQFKSVNLDDALREGFESVSDLKNELLRFYPLINKFDRLYFYQFEVVGGGD